MSLVPGPDALPTKSACLVVLDGWGLAPAGPGNAISLADTPVFDKLWSDYPHTQLKASGKSVGLPDLQMGNSEVGHLNLGAGAVVKQDLVRINDAIADGSFSKNPVLREALSTKRVHLIGLVSDGGVHSSDRHLRALIELAAEMKVEDLVIHAFTDGRDTLPVAGAGYVAEIEQYCSEVGVGRIGSIVGRYYAMDRDRRWDRTQLAFRLLAEAEADNHFDAGYEAVEAAYDRGETDEFIRPTLVGIRAPIRPQDSVLAFNFRPDRMRQITRALSEPGFTEFPRRTVPPVERYTTLTQYEEDWQYPVAFPPDRPDTTLAQVIADEGLSQLHVAETEKYAHVTYFFNGGCEDPYEGEVRQLIPSPRDVPTYDHKPEMSASEVADVFVNQWESQQPAFAIINFANPDMVGHTGSIPAAVMAIETVDTALGRIVNAVHRNGGTCIITADHGNADNMLEPDGSPNTAHSLNPVPLIVTIKGVEMDKKDGILADVAPTILAILGMPKPKQMTGVSLFSNEESVTSPTVP